MPPAVRYGSDVRRFLPARAASEMVLGLAATPCVADTPVQGPSGGLSGAGYLQDVSPARQTPPVRSQSACALVAGEAEVEGDADGLLLADEHPKAARAPSTPIAKSQCFIFVSYLSLRFAVGSSAGVQVPCRRHLGLVAR